MSTNSMGRIDLSLDRIRAVLERLGNPQHRFPVIHVAGTNSKGSTIHFLDTVLRSAAGLRVGTFTTPHLRYERDSCRINGHPIDPTVWQSASERVEHAETQESTQCTPFERLTANAFVAFDQVCDSDRPEILLVEVGMGGTLDATNVFNDKQVLASVVAAVDYDHQAFLGSTLTQIAAHKAGIVKEQGLCVIGDQGRRPDTSQASNDEGRSTGTQEVLHSIEDVCRRQKARCVHASVPWTVLDDPSAVRTWSNDSWETFVSSDVTYHPTQPAEGSSSTGNASVAGPSLRLPATRAALMGSHLALQTLWAIACDETFCALGLPGQDHHESVRLRIAYTFRDEPTARQVLKDCIEQNAQLPGRASWLTIESVAPGLQLLVDGAHNPAAAHALRHYIDSCIATKGVQDLTLTWILSFSQGKSIEQMLSAFLRRVEDDTGRLTESLSQLSVQTAGQKRVRIHHRIAAVNFVTPVEGMPWVASASKEEICETARSLLQDSGETFEVMNCDRLSSALAWAAEAGSGRPAAESGASTMAVCAGSLYLVSDVYREHL